MVEIRIAFLEAAATFRPRQPAADRGVGPERSATIGNVHALFDAIDLCLATNRTGRAVGLMKRVVVELMHRREEVGFLGLFGALTGTVATRLHRD